MAPTNYKAPPSLTSSTCYEEWLKAIEIWQTFTGLTDEKQGPAIFLTLEGKARETVLNLDIKEIKAKNGVESIVKALNKLYLKDKLQMAYETYDTFEKFRRPEKMSIKEYINEFERLLNKTKKYGSMSSDILAYRLLKSANLEDTPEQFIRATVKELTYDDMQLQLKKIFSDLAKAGDNVKDVYYQRNQPSNRRYNNNNNNKNRGRSNRIKRGGRSYRRGVSKRHKNPIDSQGNISRCKICESINHWEDDCPDNSYGKSKGNTEEVVLYQSVLHTQEFMQ